MFDWTKPQELIKFLVADPKSIKNILRHAEHWIHLQSLGYIRLFIFQVTYLLHPLVSQQTKSCHSKKSVERIWKVTRSISKTASFCVLFCLWMSTQKDNVWQCWPGRQEWSSWASLYPPSVVGLALLSLQEPTWNHRSKFWHMPIYFFIKHRNKKTPLWPAIAYIGKLLWSTIQPPRW